MRLTNEENIFARNVEISKKRNKASKKSIETKQSKGYNKFGKFTFRNLKFYLRSENYEKIVF